MVWQDGRSASRWNRYPGIVALSASHSSLAHTIVRTVTILNLYAFEGFISVLRSF